MNSENTVQQAKQGTLSVIFPGQWLLIDAKTKIFVGDKLHSTHSTKQGFSAEIPIDSDTMILKVEIGGIRSTKYELRGLDPRQDYTMELAYNTTSGKFGKKFKLSKDENIIVDINRPKNGIETQPQPPIEVTNVESPRQAIAVDGAKWYNNTTLWWSLLFWPAFIYGFYKTALIKRRTKQIIVGVLAALFIIANVLTSINESSRLEREEVGKIPFEKLSPQVKEEIGRQVKEANLRVLRLSQDLNVDMLDHSDNSENMKEFKRRSKELYRQYENAILANYNISDRTYQKIASSVSPF